MDSMDTVSEILDSISAIAGVTRKKMPGKFYVVKVGRAPGVYYNWDDCLAQVKGFKGAVFKSFPTLTEAEEFLHGAAPSRPTGSKKSKPTKYYGVNRGHVPGVYTDWESAESNIRGFKAPRYKAFGTYAEAQAFVNENGTPQPQSAADAQISQPSPSAAPVHAPTSTDTDPPSAKRRKLASTPTPAPPDEEEEDYEPGEAPLPPGATDGFDPRITLNPVTGAVEYKSEDHMAKTKIQATKPAEHAPLRIYTDGSSLGNGARGAVAGVGVYFGPRDPKNVSEPLPGTRQTNQRAELTAVLRALQLSPRNRRVEIYTDSNYAIKCVTEWFLKWRENGWLNSAKKPVENRDLVEKIVGMLEERHTIGGARTRVEFVWIKGHAGDKGNSAADELAVAGAREAKEMIARGITPGEAA